MTDPVSFLFAGGTTGGHLFPGIAVAETLAGVADRIGFVGTGTELERGEVASRGYDYFCVPAISTTDLRRRPLQSLFGAWTSFRQASQVVRQFGPTAVIGLGGYASVPAVLAAKRLGVPVTLLEQNVIPGRATRWLSRRAESVCLAYEETRAALPLSGGCRWTGNPVRNSAAIDPPENGNPLLLVLGGSQGSRSLNAAVPAALSVAGATDRPWDVVHQCGTGDVEEVRSAYRSSGWNARVVSFLENPRQWLARAELVVARAGATTLAEIACEGVAVVLVPYPFATDDHQRANADWYVNRGAAKMVEETAGVPRLVTGLADEVGRLLRSEASRRELAEAIKQLGRPEATSAVVAVVSEVAGIDLPGS
jgi:UDP-N-acetylglucosamine--N-acetylmuramyl-(pentapeptide) pyrophosphoryl-undecaprenol N-acetylglucosamine transferase